jgi:hypothetical protein
MSPWASLLVVPQIFLALALFFSPGLVLTLPLWTRLRLPACLLVMTGAAFSCLVGYAVFWVYLLSPLLGHVFGTGASLGGVAGLVFLLFRTSTARRLARRADLFAPLGLWLAAALLYQGLVFAVDLGVAVAEIPCVRFTDFNLYVDNELPFLFATKLYEGDDPRALFGDWHSSDRPPLQSGLVLQQMPVASALGVPLRPYYHLLGCVLQCMWVPAVWALSRLMSASLGKAAVVIVCVMFTGFALINSTYVWPKMLAAALVLFAFAPVLHAILERRRLSGGEGIALGMGTSLGVLAHGGSAFACLALGLVVLGYSFTLGWRSLGISLLLAVSLILPWLAYQRYYDPPGNRLVKWHLAGVIAIDDRSVSQTLVESYAAAGVAGALSNKAANVKTLVVENEAERYGGPPAEREGREPLFVSWRVWEFHQIAAALGVLNVGWIVPLAALLHRRKLPKTERITLICALAGIAAWTLLMFGPGTTIIHQGPYATFLLLLTLLAFWVVSLPLPWAIFVVALHIGCFLVVWLFSSSANRSGSANGVMIVWSILIATGILAATWRLARVPKSD